LRIALVHDWLVEAGEKEKLLFALMELFPGGEIYTLVYRPEKFGDRFGNRKVTASFLQRLPLGKTHPRAYLPLYWGLMGGFDFSDYDLIVSTSSFCAKWLRNPKKILHVCYCQDLLGGAWEGGAGPVLPGFPRWEVKWFGDYLKRCDLKSNAGVTHFLAGTEEIKARIQKTYGREAEIIPFPVDAKFQFRSQIYFRRLFGITTIPDNDKF
jgi:hypothetical protein